MLKTCKKCNGSGHILSYNHIDNGRCWACMGAGKIYAGNLAEKMAYYQERDKYELPCDEENTVYDKNGNFDPYATLMKGVEIA